MVDNEAHAVDTFTAWRLHLKCTAPPPDDLAAPLGALLEDLEDLLLSLARPRITQPPVSIQNVSVGIALQSLADNLTYSPILLALTGAANSARAGTT